MTEMPRFDPRDSGWEARVAASFARQSFMETLGARIALMAPGRVELVADEAPGLKQQHGFFHAGVSTTLADTAKAVSEKAKSNKLSSLANTTPADAREGL